MRIITEIYPHLRSFCTNESSHDETFVQNRRKEGSPQGDPYEDRKHRSRPQRPSGPIGDTGHPGQQQGCLMAPTQERPPERPQNEPAMGKNSRSSLLCTDLGASPKADTSGSWWGYSRPGSCTGPLGDSGGSPANGPTVELVGPPTDNSPVEESMDPVSAWQRSQSLPLHNRYTGSQ